MNTEIESNIPKYKKRTKSGYSKAKSKSDHKHQKKECLLIENGSPYLASYCVICGKIINWNRCVEKCEGGYYRELSKRSVQKIQGCSSCSSMGYN